MPRGKIWEETEEGGEETVPTAKGKFVSLKFTSLEIKIFPAGFKHLYPLCEVSTQ